MPDIRCRKCYRKKPTRPTHTQQSYERTRPFPSWQSDMPPPPPPPPLSHQPVAPSAISTVPPPPPPPTAPPPAPHYPQLSTSAQTQSIVNTIYHIRQISADVRQPKYENALDTLRSLQFLCQNIMTKHNLRVDYLWELDPTHHGVNGCNIGQGQQIMVRLRNETNADFRSMEEIMDTMLHELAHNHYPEHDRHFYSFWNTLRGEYEALRTNGYTHQVSVRGISFSRSRPQYRKLPSRSAFPLRSCRVRQFAPPSTTASSYAQGLLPPVAPPGTIAAGWPYAPERALQAVACPYPQYVQPPLVQARSFNPAPFTPYTGSYAAVPNAAESAF
ncbi:hypothetical protein LTR70_006361 [Exophiala xenobiotica]|uniref:WLM domain-containing protein n=1 Tax=Lithohypha guttulata TaxID=1690604 RepID=A0ABR0K7W9_9EURO|nr:hypothetical protein LTR24_005830 [Lithohypha guttulata]KAK5316306.1 hypothetical protein LTR70_006361 [Exophiala xenobiotica]